MDRVSLPEGVHVKDFLESDMSNCVNVSAFLHAAADKQEAISILTGATMKEHPRVSVFWSRRSESDAGLEQIVLTMRLEAYKVNESGRKDHNAQTHMSANKSTYS